MSAAPKQKKQLHVAEASAAYLVEPQQARHSGESRNPAPLARLAEVAEINPRRFSSQPDDAALVSFIPMKAVEEETGRLDASEMRPWRDVKKGYTPFQDGDVIFAKITPCMENGKFALAKELHNGRAAGSTEFHVFRPGPKLDPEYLLHFLFTPELRSNAKRKMQGAAGQLRVTTSFFDDVEIPLPPLDEQREIVAEIEKQFTRLEAGIAALRRVQANLKRYRAAVLKAACEGRLVPTETEVARKKGRSYESADQLLARTLAERREKWIGRGKYKEPTAPETASLPSLPDSWAWVSWETVLAHEEGAFKRGPFGSALTKSIFVKSGYKVYEQYCPINDDCSFVRYYITPEKFEELKSFEVRAGDYLISCSGVTLGRITRVPENFEEGIINQALLRVRLNDQIISHRYFLHLFRSPFFQQVNSPSFMMPRMRHYASHALKWPEVRIETRGQITQKKAAVFQPFAKQSLPT
jgi:type I restriction enzyme S subunit